MKRFILPLAFTTVATFASAENVTVFIPQEDGGVIQMEGNITVQEAALLIGDSRPPEGVTGVILEPGKPVRWTNLSPQGVNEAYDGIGDPETRGDEMLFDDPGTAGDEMTFDDPGNGGNSGSTGGGSGVSNADDPDKEDLIFEDPEKDDDKTDLTAEDGGGGAKIRPLAGEWVGVMLDQTFDGCPPGVAEAIRSQAAAMDLSTIQGDISPDFDPTVSIPQFDWTTHSPNQWIGDMNMIQNGGGMRVQWGLRVVDPRLINGRQQIDVVGPMMGGCKIFMRFQYQHVG